MDFMNSINDDDSTVITTPFLPADECENNKNIDDIISSIPVNQL